MVWKVIEFLMEYIKCLCAISGRIETGSTDKVLVRKCIGGSFCLTPCQTGGPFEVVYHNRAPEYAGPHGLTTAVSSCAAVGPLSYY